MVNVSDEVGNSFYDCCPDEPWPTITLTMSIKRAQAYYTSVVIMPLTILSFASFVPFWLDPECGERMGFGITLILAMISTQFLLAAYLPICAEELWISRFVEFLYYMSILAIGESAVVIFFHYKTGTHSVPIWYTKLQSCIWHYKNKEVALEGGDKKGGTQLATTTTSGSDPSALMKDLQDFISKNIDWFASSLKDQKILKGDQDVMDFLDASFAELDIRQRGYLRSKQIALLFGVKGQQFASSLPRSEIEETRQSRLHHLIVEVFEAMDRHHRDKRITKHEFFDFGSEHLRSKVTNDTKESNEILKLAQADITKEVAFQILLLYTSYNAKQYFDSFTDHWKDLARQIDSLSRTFVPLIWFIGLIWIRGELGSEMFFDF